MRVTLVLDIEEKETVADEAVVPMSPGNVRSYLHDVIADETKHIEATTWRVRSIVLA